MGVGGEGWGGPGSWEEFSLEFSLGSFCFLREWKRNFKENLLFLGWSSFPEVLKKKKK